MKTKIYLKYNQALRSIADSNTVELIERTIGRKTSEVRVRVIVENDNYESPKVQLAEYEYEVEAPWKSDYYLIGETTWNGTFTPDESWELVEVGED